MEMSEELIERLMMKMHEIQEAAKVSGADEMSGQGFSYIRGIDLGGTEVIETFYIEGFKKRVWTQSECCDIQSLWVTEEQPFGAVF